MPNCSSPDVAPSKSDSFPIGQGSKRLISDVVTSKTDSLPIHQESTRPALILPDNTNVVEAGEDPENVSQELIRALSLTSRYNAYFSREFKNLLAILIRMRDGEAPVVGTVVQDGPKSGEPR